jgi:hypothetical protein
MTNLIAQVPHNIGPSPVSGIGTIGLIGGPGGAVAILTQVLSTTVGVLTVIGALYFMFVLITGAIGIISAAGDKGAYEMARRRITTGAIGFVVVIAGMFLFDLVATLLGIPDILDLQAIIARIRLP